MDSSRLWRLAAACRLALAFLFVTALTHPAVGAAASLHGTIVDQLGGPVSAATATLTRNGERGSFVGAQDHSTLLSDQFFGYSMLLPNQDMDPAYQTFDVHGSYQVHPRLRTYVVVETAFDAKFAAVAGLPALPRAVRAGTTVRLGGD